VAFQSELLEVKSGDRIREIGTGSSYRKNCWKNSFFLYWRKWN